LTNYGLTQTRCGVANLVVITGPSGSTICAVPNSTVVAGSYTIEQSTLTLVPKY
jgi:hypothetical protein